MLPKGKAFKTAHLEKVELMPEMVVPHFSISKEGKGYEIECFIKPGAVAYGLNDNEIPSPLLFLYNHQLYLWQQAEAVSYCRKVFAKRQDERFGKSVA